MEYKQKDNNSHRRPTPQNSRPQRRGKDAQREKYPRRREDDEERVEQRQRPDYKKENRPKRTFDKPWKHDEDGDKPRRTFNKCENKRPFSRQWNDDEESNQRPFKRRTNNADKTFGNRKEKRFSRDDNSRNDNRHLKKDSFNRHFDDEQKDRRNHNINPDFDGQKQTTRPKKEEGLTRLNKYIANAGICSRREADELIAAGSVTVNGTVVTEMGYKVAPGDVVAYGGETLRSERKRYFLLNKPKGFITTIDDPQERQTVMMLMDGACNERIYPVGRLDRATTGLLLFTNDGELAKRLTHPSTRVYKIYQVELDKPVTRNDMQQMLDGIELEDGMIQVDDVQYAEGMNDKRIVGIALHSGRNRIVRRIFEHLGYNVHKLDRVVFAGLTKKDLPRGRYRELSQKEVGFLKMI